MILTEQVKRKKKKKISRRYFIKGAASVLCGASIPWYPSTCMGKMCRQEISFYHTHTGERLTIPYPIGPHAENDILPRLNYFLRDFRTGGIHAIDTGLLDILYHLQRHTGGRVFEVISGYRSPATNAMLRKHSRGVARKSLHLKGKAIDIRLEGVNTMTVRNCALALGRGGVGYYRKSDFVHVDTGRFRVW